MAYKGNDLDLRPARQSAPAREAPGASERAANAAGARPASADPIPVDDTVLACCNCAYDVARFHGSEDVRLEHLLHALTRVGAAAEVLAELGIRVDTLRRETAVAIAAEMPAGALADHGTPHASVAFQDVLRRAADQAAKRSAPAGLPDLLRTVLGGGPGSPAATLLMRAAADPQRLERWRDAPLAPRSILLRRRRGLSPTSCRWVRPARCSVVSITWKRHFGPCRPRSPPIAKPSATLCAVCSLASRRCAATARTLWSPTTPQASMPCSRRSSATSARP